MSEEQTSSVASTYIQETALPAEGGDAKNPRVVSDADDGDSTIVIYSILAALLLLVITLTVLITIRIRKNKERK